MRLELTLHPDCTCRAVQRIEVEAARPQPGVLALHYLVTCDRAKLLLPPSKGTSQRADELWKHTCFEAFVRAPSGAAYLEFNISSSGDWASYRFDDYRQGMRVAEDARLSARSESYDSGSVEIAAAFDLTFALGEPWRLGVSAVIEESDGAKSYWALRHAPGKPDFHHADSFAYELNP
jgi:hypothetical protein